MAKRGKRVIKVDADIYDDLLGRKVHSREPFSDVLRDMLDGRKRRRRRRKVPGIS